MYAQFLNTFDDYAPRQYLGSDAERLNGHDITDFYDVAQAIDRLDNDRFSILIVANNAVDPETGLRGGMRLDIQGGNGLYRCELYDEEEDSYFETFDNSKAGEKVLLSPRNAMIETDLRTTVDKATVIEVARRFVDDGTKYSGVTWRQS